MRGRLIVVSALFVGGACAVPRPATLAVRAHPRPVGYRVLYRVARGGGAGPDVRWEQLTVDRPFDVQDLTYVTRPAGPERPSSGSVTTVDRLFQVRDGQLQEVSGRQPGVGTADQALGAVLVDGERRGVARRLGRRTVLGRPCQDHRLLEPPAGPLKALRGPDHDDLCIDGDGLVLRERWTLGGKVVLARDAVEVVAGTAPAAPLDPANAEPPPPGGPTARPLDADAAAGAPPAPAGYHPAAADAFAFSLPDSASDGAPRLLYTSVVWAFARGGDLVTVEAGRSAEAALPWRDTDPSVPVDLPLGAATSVLRSDGSELRVDLGGQRWLRVRGTVPAAALADYARTLHP